MITLLGSLLGFFSSAFPDLFKFWRDRDDRAHELAVLDRQMEMAKLGNQQRLDEINAAANSTQETALYQTYKTNIQWVDALNGTVRPVIAYAFFLLYVLVKLNQMAQMPWQLWTDEDQAIFAGIISFYFGSRAMSKLRDA